MYDITTKIAEEEQIRKEICKLETQAHSLEAKRIRAHLKTLPELDELDKTIKEKRHTADYIHAIVLKHRLRERMQASKEVVESFIDDPKTNHRAKHVTGTHVFMFRPTTSSLALYTDLFTECLWRMYHQYEYQEQNDGGFRFGYLREVRYCIDAIYFMVDVPANDSISVSDRVRAIESNVCLNLDVDWDHVKHGYNFLPPGITLLAHDERGIRYTPRGQHLEACTEYTRYMKAVSKPKKMRRTRSYNN